MGIGDLTPRRLACGSGEAFFLDPLAPEASVACRRWPGLASGDDKGLGLHRVVVAMRRGARMHRERWVRYAMETMRQSMLRQLPRDGVGRWASASDTSLAASTSKRVVVAMFIAEPRRSMKGMVIALVARPCCMTGAEMSVTPSTT